MDGATSKLVITSPLPDKTDVEPDTSIELSLRSLIPDDAHRVGVYALRIYQVGVGYDYDITLISLNKPTTPTDNIDSNSFFGFDIHIKSLSLQLGATYAITLDVANFPFDAELPTTDSYAWQFSVRQLQLSITRFALPPKLLENDTTLNTFLQIWDGVHEFVRRRTIKKLQDGALFDIDKMEEAAIAQAFQDVDLIYPDFDEVSIERRRRILKNANTIHATRYTAKGLKYYISLLTDAATIFITFTNRGNLLYLNSDVFGLPTPEMMNTSRTGNDECTYLPGTLPFIPKITISGSIGPQMQEFLLRTLHLEIPMIDDIVNPGILEIEFTPDIELTPDEVLTLNGVSMTLDGELLTLG